MTQPDLTLCHRRGWDIVHADLAAGALGEIQRCDDCKWLPGDGAACEAAPRPRLCTGRQILEVPPGFTLAALRTGSWPELSASGPGFASRLGSAQDAFPSVG